MLNAPHPQALFRELRTLKQLRKSWYIFVFQLPWLPEIMLSRDNANSVGRMLNGSAVQKAAFPPEVTAIYRAAMSKPGAMTAALNYYRQLFRRLPGRSTTQAARITAPTLLIWGEQDIALDIALTHGLEQWVDQLQIQYLPESGHWVQQEQPEEVNQLMLAFLGQCMSELELRKQHPPPGRAVNGRIRGRESDRDTGLSIHSSGATAVTILR